MVTPGNGFPVASCVKLIFVSPVNLPWFIRYTYLGQWVFITDNSRRNPVRILM